MHLSILLLLAVLCNGSAEREVTLKIKYFVDIGLYNRWLSFSGNDTAMALTSIKYFYARMFISVRAHLKNRFKDTLNFDLLVTDNLNNKTADELFLFSGQADNGEPSTLSTFLNLQAYLEAKNQNTYSLAFLFSRNTFSGEDKLTKYLDKNRDTYLLQDAHHHEKFHLHSRPQGRIVQESSFYQTAKSVATHIINEFSRGIRKVMRVTSFLNFESQRKSGTYYQGNHEDMCPKTEECLPLSTFSLIIEKNHQNPKHSLKRGNKKNAQRNYKKIAKTRRIVESGDKPKLVQLHEEMVSFSEKVSLLEEEKIKRADLIQRVTQVTKSLWPHLKVELFGSYYTGLSLPFSDVDLLVCGKPNDPLRILKDRLVQVGIAPELGIKLISRAKFPLLKFTDAATSIKVDISFGLQGQHGTHLVIEVLRRYPYVKPLFLVLKQLLSQRHLNNGAEGGISSFRLMWMVVSFLQIKGDWGAVENVKIDDIEAEREREALPEMGIYDNKSWKGVNLGVLLMDFLEEYSYKIDYFDTSIIFADTQMVRTVPYVKRKSFFAPRMCYGLPILLKNNNIDPESDLNRDCFNLHEIQIAFKKTFHKLQSNLQSNYRFENILSSIIKVDLRS